MYSLDISGTSNLGSVPLIISFVFVAICLIALTIVFMSSNKWKLSTRIIAVVILAIVLFIDADMSDRYATKAFDTVAKDITAHTGYSVIIANDTETKDPALFYQACMEELPTTGTTPVYDAKANVATMEYKITKDKKKVILTYKVNDSKSVTK